VLVRVKEQQEMRISRMRNEMARLKGQRDVVLSRMKDEEQRRKSWRRQWVEKFRDLTKQSADLQRENRQQGRLLEQKIAEADKATLAAKEAHARRIDVLRREQQLGIQTARWRAHIEKQSARASRLQEANNNLHAELRGRDEKLKRIETFFAERARLKESACEAKRHGGRFQRADELEDVEGQIQTLDAQIEFDTERIARSQTNILRLTAADEVTPSMDGELGGTHSLEEARATCAACFQLIGELRSERSQLQERLADVEADHEEQSDQLRDLLARERLQRQHWEEQTHALQRLHLDKEVCLLGEVERGLSHGSTCTLGTDASVGNVAESLSAESVRVLRCRARQADLLAVQVEELQRALNRVERERDFVHTDFAGTLDHVVPESLSLETNNSGGYCTPPPPGGLLRVSPGGDLCQIDELKPLVLAPATSKRSSAAHPQLSAAVAAAAEAAARRLNGHTMQPSASAPAR